MNASPSERVASPTLHATIFFTISVFVAIIAMAILFRVEIVAKGLGKVTPVDRVQVVQPEFGGQIIAINVRDGDEVVKGELLIELDQTVAQAEVNTLTAEHDRLEIERYRIETINVVAGNGSVDRESGISEARERFTVIKDVADRDFYGEQERLMVAELTELADALAQIETRRIANDRAKATSQAAIDRVDAALIIQQERMDAAEALLAKQAVSRATYLDVLDVLTRLQKEREVAQRDFERVAAIDPTLTAESLSLVSALRSRLLQRQAIIDGRLFELNEALASSKRTLANTRLYAPMDGTVDQLKVFTVGGIVDSGQELMRVVPAGSEFEVEAIFPNTDVGFLEVGQKANIKLDAFPAERFGALSGEVVDISADAINITAQEFGYVVRIKPDTPYLETLAATYPLQTGMTSVTDVITGDRRLISYFFAPLVHVVQESLGER